MRVMKRRQTAWPDFVNDLLTPAGIDLLNRQYAVLKAARRFPRSVKLSRADFATVFVELALAEGRTELLQLVA